MICSLAQANDSKLYDDLTSTAQNGVVEGKDGWLFLQEEIEFLAAGEFWGEKAAGVSKVSKKEFADPLPAIVDFNTQLKDLGVELIFVPIPPKALIYPSKLPVSVSPEIIDGWKTVNNNFYSILSEQGVNVLNVTDVLQKKAEESKVYCQTDTHYSGVGLVEVSNLIAQEIKNTDWYEKTPNGAFNVSEKDIEIEGDLAKMAGKGVKEKLALSFVQNSETKGSVEFSETSPVLLLGDSHTLVFGAGGDMHTSSAGLADNLSADLGYAVDLLGVRGSGATPARIKLYQKSRKDKKYLSGKKVIVWCLTAREFTGAGGWRKVPVTSKK